MKNGLNKEVLREEIVAYLEGNLTDKNGIKDGLYRLNDRQAFIDEYLLCQDYYTVIPFVNELFKEIDNER